MLRRVILGLFGLSLVLLAGGLFLLSSFESPPEASLHRSVPQGANLYVSSFLGPSTKQRHALKELFGDSATATSAVESVFDGALKRFGMQFERDVAPWVGGEAAAFLAGDDYALLLDADDEEMAVASGNEMLVRGSTAAPIDAEYRGVSFRFVKSFSSTGRPLASGIVQGALVIGTPGGIKQAVDARAGGNSLEADPVFQPGMAKVRPDRLAMIYVRDADALVERVPGSVNFAFGLLGVEGSPYQAAIFAEDEALVVESTVREPLRLSPQTVSGFLSFEF